MNIYINIKKIWFSHKSKVTHTKKKKTWHRTNSSFFMKAATKLLPHTPSLILPQSPYWHLCCNQTALFGCDITDVNIRDHSASSSKLKASFTFPSAPTTTTTRFIPCRLICLILPQFTQNCNCQRPVESSFDFDWTFIIHDGMLRGGSTTTSRWGLGDPCCYLI